MSLPKISVICPTYNRAQKVVRAIESLVSQKSKDWELIVVDDGSKDDTESRIREFLPSDNIKYYKLEKNCGVCAARNYGITKALGEWIFLLDSDCALLDGSMKTLNEIIERNPDVSFHKFSVQTFDRKIIGKELKTTLRVKSNQFLKGMIKGEYTPCVRKELLVRHPFVECINGGEGIIWNSIVLDLGFLLYHPIVIILYDDQGDNSLSLRSKNYNRLYSVFTQDLKIHWLNYLKFAPVRLFLCMFKWIVYFCLSKFNHSTINSS